MRDLILLHGAIGSEKQLYPLADKLKDDFRITMLNFSGHGGKKIPDEKFSIKLFSEDLQFMLDKSKIKDADIFGYSMGGYVALYTALKYQSKINSIFTLATKFDWNPESSSTEASMLNPEKISGKLPAFAKELSERHYPQDWNSVLQKTSEMMIDLGNENLLCNENLNLINCKVRIGIGDRDKMVSIEESLNAYRNIPNSSFIVFPNTSHLIEKISVERLSSELRLFFSKKFKRKQVLQKP